jgi:murein DD-endopeptidase MepM/ murein hydrolase activator NlpD
LLLLSLALVACTAPPAPAATADPAHTATQAPPTVTASPTPLPSATPIPISPICSPLAEHTIAELVSLYLTQPFIAPLGENKERGHHGVDFAYYHGGPTGGHINGTPIQSVLNGIVAGFGYNPVYGNYLIVETPFAQLPADAVAAYSLAASDSLYLLYAHMQEPAPFVLDEPLDCGQVIGLVGGSGSTDFATDPHLHFETRSAASALRLGPMSFYDTQATEEEKQTYLLWRTSDTFKLFDPLLLLDLAVQNP